MNDIAIKASDILLPVDGTDLSKWAVIACDQYTSEPKFWEDTEAYVGSEPSALRVILPEVYLNEDEASVNNRLSSIAGNIDNYLENNVWKAMGNGYILLDRSTPLHPSRKGLMLAVDLEQYSFEPGNKARIRATEGTVLSRIPPRVKIRANAAVELPHIMMLIDDPDGLVIETAWDKLTKSGAALCYDTDLMLNAGHVKGYWFSEDSDIAEGVVSGLTTLLNKSEDGLLFAVGDGNHSLASAKAHWENVKKTISPDEYDTHPARYALAEAVNIHDKGIEFEPIHRVVFGIDPDSFVDGMMEYFKDCGLNRDGEGQCFTLVGNGEEITFALKNPPHSLAVGSIQQYIDKLVSENEGVEVDYIHGDDSVHSLVDGKDDNVGVLLPPIAKNNFFDTITHDGVFPRKTFSMGEAFEKRFYLEARKIR